MIFGFISAIVILLLAFCAFFIVPSIDKLHKALKAVSVVLGVVLVITFFVVPFSFRTIDTGEIAVLKYLGEAREIRQPGLYFAPWFLYSQTKYDTKVQNVEIATVTYSSDAQTMDVSMTLQYQIMAERAIDITKQYGSLKALQSRIEAIAIEKAKAVLSSHKAMDVIANRAAMSPAVEQAIKDAVGEEFFVNVTTVVLTNIDFSDAFELAVEEKMIAEQEQLKAEYQNETRVAQAEAEAKSRLISAQAAADAEVIAAEAAAEANRLLEQSLTEKIIESMYIEKWDGQLPKVSGDSTDTLVSLDTFVQ